MSSSERRQPKHEARGHVLAVALIFAALGGCSADLGRFDSMSLNGDTSRAKPGPIPREPLRRNAGAPMTPSNEPEATPMVAPGPAPVRQAGLPEPILRDSEPARRPLDTPRREPVPSRSPAAPPAAATASAGSIEVKPGDTLSGIARQHRVSVSELMSANGLQNPNIRPGQRLALPSGRRPVQARRPTPATPATVQPTSAPARVATTAPVAPSQPAAGASDGAADWHGSHTLASGETIHSLARRFHVKPAELMAANNITDPTRLRAGTVLKVPGAATAAAGASASAPPAERPAPAAVTPAAAPPSPGSPRPTIINAGSPVAASAPRAPAPAEPAAEPAIARDAPPKPTAAAAGTGRFRWPAKGKVIANFGPRGDNTHNDGINILVSQGTDVVAAESGTVAYAGSELKGYGNLLLIRHEGNWVTAYAHNETLLVKRGDKVTRGQAIAKAGKTGAVDQPQVHFELRQGSKPVDPTPHLEK